MAFYHQFEAIILSTDDLERTKEFYRRVFDVDWLYQDDVSAMFRAGPIVVGLLSRDAAADLTEPSAPGQDGAETGRMTGSRFSPFARVPLSG